MSPRTNLRLSALSCLFLAVLCAAAFGAEDAREVPPVMWYQGYLAGKPSEEPIDGTVGIEASIFSQESGGSPIWGPEVHADTDVASGWFVLELGATAALPSFDAPPYYLELMIDGEFLTPRMKLGSVPAAFHATSAVEGDGDWTVDGDDIHRTNGRVGVGTASPSVKLDVAGTVKATDIQMTNSPVDGHVLTSNASGVGSWQAPASGGIGGGGTEGYVPMFTGPSSIGNSAIRDTSGRVTIGADTSDAKLRVENAGALPTLKLVNTSSSHSFNMLELERTVALDSSDGMIRIAIPTATDDDVDIITVLRTSPSSSAITWTLGAGGRVSAKGPYWLDAYDGERYGINVTHYDQSLTTAAGIRSLSTSPQHLTAAVQGECALSAGNGRGGDFKGGYAGVVGLCEPWGSGSFYGSVGEVTAGSGNAYGVYGNASGTGTNYGVYGTAANGSTDWAGFFSGDVRVTGTLNPTRGGFEIDHPLDPASSVLRHSFVESDEMKNVYDGTVALDASGAAWVELPDWFEALNDDIRYQLTAVGAPAPNLHVAERVAGNRFRIAGGEPGMEICWMVTGVRQDASARSAPLIVEEAKSPDDVGRYVDPVAHGADRSMTIGHTEFQRGALAN